MEMGSKKSVLLPRQSRLGMALILRNCNRRIHDKGDDS